MTTTFIVPGLGSSGPDHWQTWLEARLPDAVRITQTDWTDANLADWSARVRWHFSRTPGQFLIVAHSFGVLAAVQAASDYRERIIGALLVAPADPARFGIEELLPQAPLGFPAILAASTTDRWLRIERAARFAKLWQAELVNLGDAGHINAESGHGPWPDGRLLVERLKTQADFRATAGRTSHRPVQRLRLEAERQRTVARKRTRIVGGAHDAAEHAAGTLGLMRAGHTNIAEGSNRLIR